MDIRELEDFKLSDAVKFHDELNPNLWKNDKLRPEVREQLLKIADDFLSELGISGLKVKDITVSGSNAAYTYTPYSDLDLHILVDFKQLPNDEIYQELFTSKKSLYNDNHDIKVHGVPVELYVQDSNQPVVSIGEYSLKDNDWLKYPSKRRANFNQTATRAKYEKLGSMIELALKADSLKQVNKALKIIKQYRKAGLDKTGEFGPENLAFKALRNMGLIKKLYDYKNQLHSRELSIEDYHPNATPPGPEFPPTMPSGTIRVDVSDVYDWYKLGQHISNLEGLGKHDFGKGPPSTILSFGDEDLEHKYIDALKKTGLDTTDIDPKGHEPKKGQKVDPTYNVNENIDYMAGHCHVMALALKQLHPDWKIRAHIGWEEESENDEDYRIDHVYIVAPDGSAYDCRGKFSNEQELVGPDETGGVETQLVNYSLANLKADVKRGELKKFTKDDILKALEFVKRINIKESVKFIEGTNCKNCVWWKKDSEKPVGKDELNKYGGLKPPNKEYIAMSKRVDLVTLPGKDTVKEKGFCYHKDINDWVTERMCCAKWDGKGVLRDYKGESPLMESKEEAVRKIQKFLNKKYDANLDVDGVLGPLTLKSINKFMPQAKKASAPEPDKTTAIQGKEVKEVLDTEPGKTNKAKWDFSDTDMQELNFTASNGQQYRLDFLAPYIGPDEINQYKLLPDASDKYLDHGFFVQFEQVNKRSPWKQGKQGIEGTGAAAEIFGIVSNAILQFVKKKKPTYLYFQAAESNRISLYSAMIKRLLPNLPGWKAQGPSSDGVFTLYSPFKKVTKEASGYIPTEKEKNDPRFSTALTVDVKPDSIKKNAKAFGFNVTRSGNPPLLRK